MTRGTRSGAIRKDLLTFRAAAAALSASVRVLLADGDLPVAAASEVLGCEGQVTLTHRRTTGCTDPRSSPCTCALSCDPNPASLPTSSQPSRCCTNGGTPWPGTWCTAQGAGTAPCNSPSHTGPKHAAKCKHKLRGRLQE